MQKTSNKEGLKGMTVAEIITIAAVANPTALVEMLQDVHSLIKELETRRITVGESTGSVRRN